MGLCCILESICTAVVGLFAAGIVWEFIWPFVIAKLLNIHKNVKSFGEWAVITGATDGIGKAYASVLASKGMNICLISRTKERLDAVADEIRASNPVKVNVIQFDFGTTDLKAYEKLEVELKKLDIGVLVNNVGTGYEYPEYFHDFPGGLQAVQRMITVNCTAGALLTHIVLPSMFAKKKGAIVNVSSASCFFPSPLISLYGGSKAFMDSFTRALQVEYQGSGVIIQAVAPFFVVTKLARLRTATFFAPTPTSYARAAVATIGVQPSTVGYPSHGLQLIAIRILPHWLLAKLCFCQMRDTRARALKKKATAETEKKSE